MVASENGLWGILFLNNDGLNWISADKSSSKLILSYQTLFQQFSSFGNKTLSPDGKTVILTSGGGIYSVNVKTGESTLVFESSDYTPMTYAWSPDSRRVAFQAHSRTELTTQSIRILNLDGRDEEIVIPNYFALQWGLNTLQLHYGLHWYDSDTLMFAAIVYPPSSESEPSIFYSALFTINTDGSDLRQITPVGVNIAFPSLVLPASFLAHTSEGEKAYFLCDASPHIVRANKICRIDLATFAVEQVVDLGDFGINTRFESHIITQEDLDQMQDGDLMGDLVGQEATYIVGTIVSRLAVSTDGKIAIEISNTEDAALQQAIYLYDPQANTFDYFVEGSAPQWFYFTADAL